MRKLKNIIDSNNLSSLVIFERQLFGKTKIKPEHYYAAQLFINEARLHDYEDFKAKTALRKGQNFKSEYTKMIKSIIGVI